MHTGCKKKDKVTKFHDRTAGIMAIVKPCGVIIDYREMLTCESASQLFVQLLNLVDQPTVNIKYIGYDRACEFHPFLRNLQKKGNQGAEVLLDLKYVVDRFHIKGHTTAYCDIKDAKCRYHPDLAKFSALEHVNTEGAEQTFAWLKKYKDMLKYMSCYKFRFILDQVVNARNSYLVKRKCLNLSHMML